MKYVRLSIKPMNATRLLDYRSARRAGIGEWSSPFSVGLYLANHAKGRMVIYKIISLLFIVRLKGLNLSTIALLWFKSRSEH